MREKGLTVEDELQSQMNSIYEKNVPQATRRYLERNDPLEQRTAESAEDSKRKPSMTDDERKEFNARRREQRKAEKIQLSDSTSASSVANHAQKNSPAEPVMTM